jgi:glycosyltransferase involved in cell wall biosynthesis
VRVGRSGDDAESLQILAATAENLVRVEGHHLVHGFFAVPAGHVATCVAKLTGRPVCVSLRGNDVDRAMFHGPRLAMLSFVTSRADALIGVSREILGKVTALTGRTAGLHRIPNGIDVSRFVPATGARAGEVPQALKDAPRPWIAFAGELRLKKGLPVLEALAVRLAAARRGRLVCLGGIRTDVAGEHAWASLPPVARARIREVPYEADAARLAQLYGAMDLFVFPSLWDGLPNAVLEAMACARPVLATAVGGIPDVIEDGVSGFLVAPEALERFPEQALELLEPRESERLARIGAEARSKVARSFTVEAERDAHLAVWRGLLA